MDAYGNQRPMNGYGNDGSGNDREGCCMAAWNQVSDCWNSGGSNPESGQCYGYGGCSCSEHYQMVPIFHGCQSGAACDDGSWNSYWSNGAWIWEYEYVCFCQPTQSLESLQSQCYPPCYGGGRDGSQAPGHYGRGGRGGWRKGGKINKKFRRR